MSVKISPEKHSNLGNIVVFKSDGWVIVGESSESQNRRSHWFRFEQAAIRNKNPFVTYRDIKFLTSHGYYYAERRTKRNLLRYPDDLVDFDAHLDSIASTLNWYEAKVICQLLGGRLATEKEFDLIYNEYLKNNFTKYLEQVWTESDWSDWSYSLCGYDKSNKRWYAVDDDSLIDSKEDSKSVVAFSINPFNRERVEDLKKTFHGALLVFDI